jgi:hypothetical protein
VHLPATNPPDRAFREDAEETSETIADKILILLAGGAAQHVRDPSLPRRQDAKDWPRGGAGWDHVHTRDGVGTRRQPASVAGAQDAAIVAWLRLNQLRSPELFSAWLKGIGRHTSQHAVRAFYLRGCGYTEAAAELGISVIEMPPVRSRFAKPVAIRSRRRC